MLYSEFVEGTQCKENAHNYEVYKNLEIMYMNSDMTKSQIYEYGKKLVDNSKSEKEIQYENEIKEKIEEEKKEVEYWEGRAKFYLEVMQDEDKEYVKLCKKMAKEHRQRIKELRWCLA